jgi:hypothetical protein
VVFEAVGIFGWLRSFIGSSSFFFVFGMDVVFLNRSGRLREERQQRRAVGTVWRLKIKGFSRISL